MDTFEDQKMAYFRCSIHGNSEIDPREFYEAKDEFARAESTHEVVHLHRLSSSDIDSLVKSWTVEIPSPEKQPNV